MNVTVTYRWRPLRYSWVGGITLGHRIYFKRSEADVTPEMLKHEMCHVAQIERHGFVAFYLKYLWYSLRHGYKSNPFEVEARAAESK